MGTRSITVIKDKNGLDIVHIYGQYDGYLEGMGTDLTHFIQSTRLVNGFPIDATNVSNGMNDLAAQIIFYLKRDNLVGNIYIYAPKINSDDLNGMKETYWADYVYIISKEENKIRLVGYSVSNGEKILDIYGGG